MRISDWSSDVCSSDLPEFLIEAETLLAKSEECLSHLQLINNDKDAIDCMLSTLLKLANKADALADRKSVVKGKSVSVRGDLGGRRVITKNTRLYVQKSTVIEQEDRGVTTTKIR